MNSNDLYNKARTFKLSLLIGKLPYLVRFGFGVICFFVGLSPLFIFLSEKLLSRISPLVGGTLLDTIKSLQIFIFENTMIVYAVSVSALTLFMINLSLGTLHSFHRLRGIRRVFEENVEDITYEVAHIFLEKNVTLKSLIMESGSNFLIKRLSVDKNYLISNFGDLSFPNDVELAAYSNPIVTLGVLWRVMYDMNPSLEKYFLSLSVKKKTLVKTALWMDRLIEEKKKQSAWWWRENLSKTRGIGKVLSYGTTGVISHHAKEMIFDSKIRELGDVVLHQEECNQLEEILAKRHGSNAVVVGPDGSGRYSMVLALARAIDRGYVFSEIEHKRMFLLDVSSFELINEKVSFENVIIETFNEAVVAQNIIFVIDEVTKMVQLAKHLDIDFWSLISPYINHGAVSLVVLVNEPTFSNEEYSHVFEDEFEVIKMRDLNEDLFLPYLEDKVVNEERVTGKYFTYTALETIAKALPVFFVEDAPLVKANSIVEAIATNITTSSVITDKEVNAFLQSTTGVSLGTIDEEEKSLLLNLEEILSQNVKGQKEAVSAVAKTMRRLRSGITDGGKPMGTFLFFGPSGSGKTETAKTLAKVFFGNEEYMSRLDMGEYTLPESVKRLLGDKDNEGDLAHLIHSRPHGVLLLDEFEKSSKEVKDLFLKILDEGIFTNGQGHTVSLRTQIIIATSNAGTQFILESHLSGEYEESRFVEIKQKVVDYVLEQTIFKPELINRFDAAVMFLPLSNSAVIGVATKMLDELSLRIRERGYEVVWADDLVEYVVENSNVSEFGGRAIQRTIQDVVEDVLSKKIIKGEIKEGDTLTLSKEDVLKA